MVSFFFLSEDERRRWPGARTSFGSKPFLCLFVLSVSVTTERNLEVFGEWNKNPKARLSRILEEGLRDDDGNKSGHHMADLVTETTFDSSRKRRRAY